MVTLVRIGIASVSVRRVRDLTGTHVETGLRDVERRNFCRPTGRAPLLGGHECRSTMPALHSYSVKRLNRKPTAT